MLKFLAVAAALAVAAVAAAPPGLYGLSPDVALLKCVYRLLPHCSVASCSLAPSPRTRIDPISGNMTKLGQGIAYEGASRQLATIDDFNDIFYFIGLNETCGITSLVGLNLTDGSIISESKLPYVIGFYVGVGEVCDFDPNTGEVVTMGMEVQPVTPHHIVRINPTTSQVTDLAALRGYDGILGGASGLDPVAGIEWVTLIVNDTTDVFGIDVMNGSVARHFPNVLDIETFNYDPMTGLMVCIGLDDVVRCRSAMLFAESCSSCISPPSQRVRALYTFNSYNGEFTRIGDIPGELPSAGSVPPMTDVRLRPCLQDTLLWTTPSAHSTTRTASSTLP
jgi:hypothetical protein